jgi:hypothetical protein
MDLSIPLVLVWAVAAAHPASAAPPGVRPGGPVNSLSTPRQNTIVTSSNWAGYGATGTSGAARSSAEVIAEAPCCTSNGGILPLTNFGTASFGSAAANGQFLATFHPTEIVMPDTSVSPISSSGDFTVSYTGFPGFPGFPWFGPGRSAAD